MEIRTIAKKTLPILLTLALTTGCSFTTKLADVKTKVLGAKYTALVYDGIFSAKGPSSKSKNSLEVFAAKYKDKNMYKKRSFYQAPINELTYGWEIILKDENGFKRLTNNSVQEYHPRISPDGTYTVFEKWNDKNKKSDIYKIDLTALYTGDTTYPQLSFTETRLTDKESCGSPVVSPDSEQIAFNYNGNIWVMDKDGKNQRELLNLNVDTRVYEWTEKGLIFAYGDSIFANAVIDFEKKEVRDYHIGQE